MCQDTRRKNGRIEEGELVTELKDALQENYPNINDFCFEYRAFQGWHISNTPFREQVLTFWFDLIRDYALNRWYLRKLEDEKAEIAQIENFTVRREAELEVLHELNE